MTGIETTSNQSEIPRNKLFRIISAALMACMLILGTGLQVFATSSSSTEAPEPVPLDANLYPITMDLANVTTQGHLTPYQLIDDYGLTYDLTHNTADVYDLDITPANDYITVVFRGLITTQYSWSGISEANWQSPFFAASNVSFRITVGNLNITSTIERCSVENLEATSNYDYHGATDIYNATSSAFSIRDAGTMFTEYISAEPIIRYQYLVFASYRVPCTNANFNSVIANIATQTVTVSASDPSSGNAILKGWIGEYNSLEMLNYIQTQLYEIYKYDQGIFSEIASVLTRLSYIDNRLISILAQISANAQQNHSDLTALYQLLYNYINPANASSNESKYREEMNDIIVAESEAMSAMESAIPEYEDEWEELESYNAASEISLNHNAAITFWKQVTEYILNTNNIGAAASGLILVSLIAFIVFLLRL